MVVLDEPCSRVGYAAADMNQTDTQSPGKLDGEGRREPPLPADDPAIFELDLRGLRAPLGGPRRPAADLRRGDDGRRPPSPGARRTRSSA